ncbi:hypothetical protein BCR44DRAFT_1427227, partial [Catenaria anguillulae PL171]
MMALKSDAILDVHWHIIAWWAGRVKAGDERCKVDMHELKTAVLEWEAPSDDDLDDATEPEAEAEAGVRSSEVWPRLIKYF